MADLKPDLVDAEMQQKVVELLESPKEDYWGPTKNVIGKVFNNWIKPNWAFWLIVLGLVLFLIWRYRYVKRKAKHAKPVTQMDLLIEAYRKQQSALHEPKIPD